MFVLSAVTEENAPLNEQRQSARLQQTSYYNTNRNPVISYKEKHYRLFKKRKSHPAQPSSSRAGSQEDTGQVSTMSEPNTASRCSPRSWKKLIFAFVVSLLFLGYGYMYHSNVYMQQGNNACSAYRRLLSTDSDRIPNFADLYKGATVIIGRSSDTYGLCGLIQRFQLWLRPKQMTVLQPESPLVPGRCWPFDGDRGHLHIQLSDSITISHVTLGHIGKTQSITGYISSAPREFSVYGLKTLGGEEKLLGTFDYDQNGPSFQTFALLDQEQTGDTYRHMRLQVNSNWGNNKYTCLYSVRVHGNIPVRSDIKT